MCRKNCWENIFFRPEEAMFENWQKLVSSNKIDLVHEKITYYFLDDVCTPHTNEAYTTVCLPASASNKGIATLWVKVGTEASRYVLPVLCLFKHLYPITSTKQDASNTKLTAYNGTQIPLFGSLHGSITWQTGSPSVQPHQMNSHWYVAGIPSPAFLGPPLCER